MITPSTLLPWQQADWQRLRAYIDQQRVPQAVLITGNKGLGKQQLAHLLIQALLCDSPQAEGLACGQCSRCLLLKAGSHPDFLNISPEAESKAISVNQIRGLIDKLSLKPQFEGYRVVLINPADALNNNSVNAFLKCLEEPAERSVIVLVSERPRTLPATLLSRCQQLPLATPNRQVASTWLQQQQPQLTTADSQVLLNLAQNAPLLALEFAHEGILDLRATCFAEWEAIAMHKKHPVLVAENWQKLPEQTVLFWLTSWVSDMIQWCYLDKPPRLYNQDLNKPLHDMAKRIELKGIYRLYDLLLASRQRIGTTINKQCLFEEILINWFQLNQSH